MTTLVCGSKVTIDLESQIMVKNDMLVDSWTFPFGNRDRF